MALVIIMISIGSSIGSFLFAKTCIPQMKELLVNKKDLHQKMFLFFAGFPIVYAIFSQLILSMLVPSSIHSFAMYIYRFISYIVPILFVVGIFFGTKFILGSDIQVNKISMVKFTIVYIITMGILSSILSIPF